MQLRRQTSFVLLVTILIGQLLSTCLCAQSSYALDLENMLKDGIKNQLPHAPQEPIKVDRKNQKLEDLIPRQDIPYGYPPMIPLQGITIQGLGPKAIACLGENYFVVRNNTNATRMSDLYRDNRNSGKANFVTMDCVAHPYLAFTNRIHAETIKKYLLPLTKTILFSMLRIAVNDYKQADDEEVRTDIESNVAFLSLALKLMEPSFPIPLLGRVPQLVQSDYDALVFAKPGHSYIYDRDEDFSNYKPFGWYRSSPELVTFYRVKTWLSRLSYPINDVTFENKGVKLNNFRRSVLLYRCLELARIDGKPAMDYWMRLVKGMFLLGGQVENWQEKNLYAHDYKSVFKSNSTDLKVTLNALAEPLYRTKLLLAVRKQKPLSLGSTSIFDLDEARADRETVACFKFIPAIGSPEDPWMRYAANLYPKPGLTTNVFPVALLDLNAWGAPQAANFLLDSSWAMDESMPKTVTELKRWVLRRNMNGQVQPVDCRIWNILSPSWRLLPDGIQIALRDQMWSNHRLESVFSAWLDNRVSIAPLHYAAPKNQPAAVAQPNTGMGNSSEEQIDEAISSSVQNGTGGVTSPTAQSGRGGVASSSAQHGRGDAMRRPLDPKTINNPSKSTAFPNLTNRTPSSGLKNPINTATPPAGGVRSSAATSTVSTAAAVDKKMKPMAARRAARGHFLDPCPDFYNRLLVDTQNIEKELTAQGFLLDPQLKRELDDYARLFQRLFKIAKDEVECKPVSPQDLSLLANIDMILDKIDLPLPAVVSVEPQANFNQTPASASQDKDADRGFSMALGRPGLLYIILMNKDTKEWTLARGAVYTYYEQYGTTLNEESLLSKIDRGAIQPTYWTERFDFVQADKK